MCFKRLLGRIYLFYSQPFRNKKEFQTEVKKKLRSLNNEGEVFENNELEPWEFHLKELIEGKYHLRG